MTYLTESRDALATALHNVRPHHRRDALTIKPHCCCRRDAQELIASGAVIDASTLADDEVLVERFKAALYPVTHNGHMFTPGACEDGSVDARWCGECGQNTALDALRALAAALTERSQR